MSLRENITKHIIDSLKEIEDPRPVLVTREPFDVTELAITQFPALLVNFAVEERNTVTMGPVGTGRREGTIDYEIRCFVRGTELDRRRNELVEAIEEKLDEDRYRDLRTQGVLNSQIVSIEVIPRLAPLAEVLIVFRVNYNYLRGTT